MLTESTDSFQFEFVSVAVPGHPTLPPKKLLDKDLVHVKKSTLPNAGQGLFASQRFVAGDHLCGYEGKLIDALAVNRIPYEDRCYIVQVSYNKCIDATPGKDNKSSSLGQFANTLFSYNKQDYPSLKLNAKLVCNRKNNTARLVATRKISVDEEIFLRYGRPFTSRKKTSSEKEEK